MKLVHAIILATALAGCSSKPSDDASGQPTPRVTQTVTASPTPTETPTPDVTHYRMMTVVAGHADVTFVVALNGNTVGTLNGDTNGDLTPSVLPGDNAVVVSWTQAHPLKSGEKATLTIERQIPGQDDWTTVYSRVVDATTKIKEAKGTFAHEALGDNSATGATMEGSSGGGYNPSGMNGGGNTTDSNTITGSGGGANMTNGANVSGGTNTTTGNHSSSPSNITSGANQTTPGNLSRTTGSNSTTGSNLTQAPRPAMTPPGGTNTTGTIPGRGAAGNTSPITP
ncbi:hypothetical protein ABS71_19250 [bacterium SCN 62-11]|nr:hypothetical protein [Candidatus Eremiobacteraeota bacterium]ODT57861.1 MAG: hypothetical protein ABS71_19250 [bacterium SCN 62-11]